MKLSIVTTLYRSEATVDEFYRRCMAAAAHCFSDVELIFVDDGSPDDSLARALTLAENDPRVVVIEFSRNFGHYRAMMAGLSAASGDYVFLLDSDLEEEPEWLGAYWDRLRRDNCDVVYGVQESRKGSWFEHVTGEFFYWLVDKLSEEKIPRNLVTARLMKRQYVRALLRHRDREFFIAQLWLLTGFRQQAISVKKLALSPTTYSIAQRTNMLVRYVTTTSTKLLYIILYTGCGIAGLSALAVFFTIGRYLWTGVAADGWSSIIVAICFFGGLTTLILGIIGIYVANIFSETKRRPYVIVRQVHRDRTLPSSGS
ncbi:glycosyltransferase family 2 protein [Bosea sp. NPDC003192]|uniref:glycosyltransferase family 2 protein n=1 Tax=Bosea sp. NPDC003192 TaxID=3390551 RepID=UPI003D084A48